MQTSTGEAFDLANPKPEMVDIRVIAHHLARISRFTGATGEPFSVAQHCVWVAQHVKSEELRLPALLHDAAEAYIGDISQPMKRLLGKQVREIEEKVMDAIVERFGLVVHPFYSPEIAEWDVFALATERRDLMAKPKFSWGIDARGIQPLPGIIKPWGYGAAEIVFLRAFKDYSRLDI